MAIRTVDGPPSYRNPGCYAASRGDCSTELSGEQFVSDSILRLTGGKAVTTRRYPWNRDGEATTTGISSFTAKILCTRHNALLASCDTAGRDFAAGMTNYAFSFSPTRRSAGSPKR